MVPMLLITLKAITLMSLRTCRYNLTSALHLCEYVQVSRISLVCSGLAGTAQSAGDAYILRSLAQMQSLAYASRTSMRVCKNMYR